MQGHICKRGKGSWSVVLDLGRDPLNGKRRQLRRSVKGTRRIQRPCWSNSSTRGIRASMLRQAGLRSASS
jgi:hypothetical protein